ncbi:MAG: LuxR C-terminal-related transcriptional regulator [Gaiellaceae bacterium]
MFVIDPHSISRAGIESLVAESDELEIVGTASNEQSSLRSLVRRADLITVAVEGGLDAHLAALRRIRSKELCPEAKILLMCRIERQAEGWTAVRAGASGCVSLTLDRCSLIRAMLLAINGAVVFMPGPAGQASSPRVEETADEPSPLRAGLSEREQQVLALLARGLSNGQIARELILAEATVKKHLTGAMRKIGKADRLGAGLYAVRHGIDDGPLRPLDHSSARCHRPREGSRGGTPDIPAAGDDRSLFGTAEEIPPYPVGLVDGRQR